MSADSLNWARTVGAFKEVYNASTAGTPFGQTPVATKSTPATLAQAKSLGFDSAKGITIQNGQYVFDKSLAPDREGFTSVGVAKPGQVQMTPYYGDVTGSYKLNQDQFAGAYNPNDPSGILKIMRQNEIDALVKQGVSPEDAVNQVDKVNQPRGGDVSGGGGNVNTGTGSQVTSATPDAANKAVLDQIAALTQQIANMQSAAAAEAAKPKVVGQKTVRKSGGVVEVYETMSDGTQGSLLSSYTDFGARDSVMKMFENTGLGQAYITSLMDTVDQVYRDNIAPTEAQVLNSIYNSDAYKTRFAANEVIKKRMSEGKGRPGDKLLTPYEYIQTEKAYEEILREAGMPLGFYDQQEDFSGFIAGGVSAAELTERVNIAKNALNNADEGIKTALKDYYGLTNEDLTAYLLDKDRAMNLIDSRFKYTTEEAKKMYTAAEIGGAALRAGQMSDKAFAEEIYKSGKAGQAESAFQTAAVQQEDYKRLMGLYGETAGEQDIAREELALAGGTDVTVKKKKLASKERAMFQQKSAIDATSLGRRNKTADV
jgi:hypothetical protein